MVRRIRGKSYPSSLNRHVRLSQKIHANPALTVGSSFLITIIIGTGLLLLPQATINPGSMSVIDAVFTATSATCVTGLIVQDTAHYFSRFGQGILLALIQIGGLGIMTLSALFAITLGRKMSLSRQVAVSEMLDISSVRQLRGVVLFVGVSTLILEAIGSGALWWFFRTTIPDSGERLFYAVFHAVSAFCNAGFSLFPDSLMSYRANGILNGIIAALIILGGLGFPVLMSLPRLVRRKRYAPRYGFPIHARIVVLTTLFLIMLGAGALFIFESNHLFSDLSWIERVYASLFQSITARTAGFNTIPIEGLRLSSLVMLMALMFCGGAPGSTAGGIKVTTCAVIVMSLYARLRRKEVVITKKRIAALSIERAFILLASALIIIFIMTILLSATEQGALEVLLFEVVSAFGTVGLSCGITPLLTTTGKAIICCTMFLGRIGPLAIVLALQRASAQSRIVYPEERVIIG